MKTMMMFALMVSVAMLSVSCMKTAAVDATGEAVTEPASTPVQSDALKLVRYDAANQTLTVGFERGTYTYEQVPADVYEKMISSGSLGSFYLSNIKGKYKGTKVE